MSQIRQKLTIWWPKQGSVFEKVKPHWARIIFWKSVKRYPKWFDLPNFFYFIPNYGSSGACPQKMTPIGQKLTIWWPKQGSVFEKGKPHRARIIFWKSVKTCPKWLAPPNFFILSPILAHLELAHKKWTKSNQNWRFVDQNKVRCSKKLSLIEHGYFFENR